MASTPALLWAYKFTAEGGGGVYTGYPEAVVLQWTHLVDLED